MRTTFRQSMAWLHTWAGLTTGWVLFFVFVMGTFGYVMAPVTRWMRPEFPVVSSWSSTSTMLTGAESYLRAHAAGADEWHIALPYNHRGVLSVWWSPESGRSEGTRISAILLDPRTAEVMGGPVRQSGGGGTLYAMHVSLRYVRWGHNIVLGCTMFMLVAILTGIVTHKKIFADFFTFRPGIGQRSWLDAHTLVSVATLPFCLMITWTGLLFTMFVTMPAAQNVLYPDADAILQFNRGAYEYETDRQTLEPPGEPGNLVPLAQMLARVEQRWGQNGVSGVTVARPGFANAIVTFEASRTTAVRWNDPELVFDGMTGELRGEGGDRFSVPRTPVGRFFTVMIGLHGGQFGGVLVRTLFVLSGLTGAVMVATGLILWSTKRRAKLARSGLGHPGIAIVDILNVATLVGLPIGMAAYFWANRLLPIAMAGRADWEVHTLFIVWSLTLVYALCRGQRRSWIELSWIATAGWGFLPVLNALTTDRHLGVTIPAADWGLAIVDLAMLGTGLFFTVLARQLRSNAMTSTDTKEPRAVSTVPAA